MNAFETYQSPWGSRYSSEEMKKLFSPQVKYSTWRRLWVALAEAQQELGLPITKKQIQELKNHQNTVNFKRADALEKELKHDVMAHIKAFAEDCPTAAPIIHWGATSCYVTDNTDLLLMQAGLKILLTKLQQVIDQFATFASKHADLPCVSYTHFQPAQPTTVGKRACLWLQEFVMDQEEMQMRLEKIRFLGVKGATGTQASFLELFHDSKKVEALDKKVAKKMGFSSVYTIAGQTYTRKQDSLILNALAGLAASIHKCATDIRLLSHTKEIQEGFGKNQVGSSAMPYKRNPIIAERLCGLARTLIALAQNPLYTSSLQWLERSLDDSSNRRVVLPEAFLCADALLEGMLELVSNLYVNKAAIEENLNNELPLFAMEHLLMAAVKKGGNRQTLHEKLRKLKKENIAESVIKDKAFGLSAKEVKELLRPTALTGQAKEQVERFLKHELKETL